MAKYETLIINERTQETLQGLTANDLRACIKSAKSTAAVFLTVEGAQRYTRIEITRTKPGFNGPVRDQLNLIYRRMDNGVMKWVDEDEFLGCTEDDGKDTLEVNGQTVQSVDAACKYMAKVREPQTVYVRTRGSHPVTVARLRMQRNGSYKRA